MEQAMSGDAKEVAGLAENVFRLCPQVVMEGFEEGALLLRLQDRHLFELNPTAHRVLALTDGQRHAAQVAAALAEAYQISEAEALQDTVSLYAQLSAQGVVEMVEPSRDSKENRTMEETSVISPRYVRNPDVVLREEDPDGGLLFNPDTNQVKVVNTTGVFIWQQCDGPRELDEIVTAVQKAFGEEAPAADQVAQDVREFVEEMVESGFIGTVEALGSGD
jgi:hypothetical protein